MGRVVLVGLLVAVLGAGAIACRKRGASEDRRPDQRASTSEGSLAAGEASTIAVRVPALPAHLNPLLGGADVWCQRIVLNNVLEPLVRSVAGDQVVPVLAERFEWRAGGLVLQLQLRSDARFHDGRPLGSEDVVFTFEQLMGTSPVNTVMAAELEAIAHVEAVGERSVELQLAHVDRTLLQVLARVPILSARQYRHADPSSMRKSVPLGTGPYRLVTGSSGRVLKLERFDGYWGPKPPLARIRIDPIADPARALAALRNGEVEILADLHPEYFPSQVISKTFRQRFTTHRLAVRQLRSLLFNCRRRALKDRRVRVAIAQLIDVTEVAKRARGGLARLVSAPLPPASAWYDSVITPRVVDPTVAQGLLAAAGWEGEHVLKRLGHPLELRMLCSKEADACQVAERVSTALRASGIVTGADPADFGFAASQLHRGRFDLAVVGLTIDTTASVRLYLHSKGALNVGGYDNPQVDTLLDALRATDNREQQISLGHRLHQLLVTDPPLVVLYAPVEMIVVSRRIVGFPASGSWPSFATLRPVAP